jgi:predicted DNA-binding WGR domain protein
MNSLHFQFDLDRNMKKFYIILQEIYRAGNKVTLCSLRITASCVLHV